MLTLPTDRPTRAAEDIRSYADRLHTLADELDRIERDVTADEITYQLRDGEVAVVELVYYLHGPDTA